MIIRRGVLQDSEIIASYLFLAMQEIAYRFIGQRNPDLAMRFLTQLVSQQANQYSYENNWVIEDQGEVLATALVYDGSRLAELREPVAKIVTEEFAIEFNPEDETQAGEYYIDCIGVNPDHQGKGLGSKLILHLIQEYVTERGLVLGLLVDDDNPKAKKLYERLGFEVVGEKWLMGKHLQHLQIK